MMRELAKRLGGETREEESLSVREVRYAKTILKCLARRVEEVDIVWRKDKLHILPGKEEVVLRRTLHLLKTSANLERDEAGRVLKDNQLVDLMLALFHIREEEGAKERKLRCEEIVDLPVVHRVAD